MIIPLKASISALERPESWQDDELEFLGQWSTPRYRVELTAYDTDKREVREWSFWSMEDKTIGLHNPTGKMRARAVLFEDVRAMHKLRAELDKAIKPRSRWDAFSDEELAELDSLIAAAEESYGVSDDALQLSAEVKAERDHRETRLS